MAGERSLTSSMGFVNGARRLFGSRRRDQAREKRTTEQDVALDGEVASSRATGGEHAELSGDRGSVTGTGRTQDFVGRTAGDDVGYAGETGAERRAVNGQTPTEGGPRESRQCGTQDKGCPAQAPEADSAPDIADGRVLKVHRIGAVLVAVVIATFGLLGLAGGLDFFSTRGESVAGLSSNGLLSVISLITAGVLIVAAAVGGRRASTTMIIVGLAFLVSAFANLIVLDSERNILAFELPNVFFSIGAGLVLLLLGTYGRVSGNLPADNPYYLNAHRSDPNDPPPAFPRPPTPAETAADIAMAEAERAAAAAGAATPEQQRRIDAMSQVRAHEDRRRVWMNARDESRRCRGPRRSSI